MVASAQEQAQLQQQQVASSRGGHISLDGVREKNVMQLRKLNVSIFPVRYQDKFYEDAVHSGEFSKLALYNDIYVGAISCRLEKKTGVQKLYIMTLGVLAPYRRLGIGTRLLQHCFELCKQDKSVTEIYLHVQVNNDEAIQFYKKFGFAITGTVSNYYRRIQPADCYVLSKVLNENPTV